MSAAIAQLRASGRVLLLLADAVESGSGDSSLPGAQQDAQYLFLYSKDMIGDATLPRLAHSWRGGF